MSIVKNRKVVNICWDANSSKSIDVGLNLSFQPDEMIVRQICYYATNSTVHLFQVWSEIVPDQPLFLFPNGSYFQVMESHYMLRDFSLNRNWKFEIQNVPSGTGPSSQSTTADGKIGMILEFIQTK